MECPSRHTKKNTSRKDKENPFGPDPFTSSKPVSQLTLLFLSHLGDKTDNRALTFAPSYFSLITDVLDWTHLGLISFLGF